MIAVLVGYPLSFFPACWLVGKDLFDAKRAMAMYSPIMSVRPIELRWIVWHNSDMKSGYIEMIFSNIPDAEAREFILDYPLSLDYSP